MNVFNPVDYSIEENQFLLKHLGEPSVVALQDIKPVRLAMPNSRDKNPVHYPDGVVPAAVKPALDRIYELIELEKHQGATWVGLEAVKGRIQVYLDQTQKWVDAKTRNRRAPRFPSMFSFSAKGTPAWQGPGADCAKVKTFFDASGKRVDFAVELIGEEDQTWKPDWLAERTVGPLQLVEDQENHRIECPIDGPEGKCGHTESYRSDSRASHAAARARMSKHLRKAPYEAELHREVYTNEFGGGDAQ